MFLIGGGHNFCDFTYLYKTIIKAKIPRNLSNISKAVMLLDGFYLHISNKK